MKKQCCFVLGVLVVGVSLYRQNFFVLSFCLSIFLLYLLMKLLQKSRISNNWKKTPDLLRSNSRNYSFLELGYKAVRVDSLDLTQKYTNLYSDFLVLQRFYSLVKQGGTIIFNMWSSEYYMSSHRPSLFSLCMLHPVTLLELGRIYFFYEYMCGEILNPLLFLIKEIIHRNDRANKNCKCNREMMSEIEAFCGKRNLKIEWHIDGQKINLRSFMGFG